jgi:hypothetical protein
MDASGEILHRMRCTAIELVSGAELKPHRLLSVTWIRHADDLGLTLGDAREDADDASDGDALLGGEDFDEPGRRQRLPETPEYSEDIACRVVHEKVVAERVERDINVDWAAVNEVARKLRNEPL